MPQWVGELELSLEAPGVSTQPMRQGFGLWEERQERELEDTGVEMEGLWAGTLKDLSLR